MVIEVIDDSSSAQGKFLWREIAGICVPVLLRSDKEYISTRVAERSFLSQLLQVLPTGVICSGPKIESSKATSTEIKLLNEINSKHSDYFYGKGHFPLKELLVEKNEIFKYHQYLEICYKKLIAREAASTDRCKCGFLKVGGGSNIPYVDINLEQYLPKFYFDDDTEVLKGMSIEGWDWAYLKFCCKVQGIKDDFIDGETCEVVALSELKQYLPSDTTYEEFWPSEDITSRFKSYKQGNWTSIFSTGIKKFGGKLQLIKDYPIQESSSRVPYRVLKCVIEDKVCPSVNIRPYQYNNLLVTLPKLVNTLFPKSTDEQVGNMLASNQVILYKGNPGHIGIIQSEGWQDGYDQVPLVIVKDFLANIHKFKSDNPSEKKRFKGV